VETGGVAVFCCAIDGRLCCETAHHLAQQPPRPRPSVRCCPAPRQSSKHGRRPGLWLGSFASICLLASFASVCQLTCEQRAARMRSCELTAASEQLIVACELQNVRCAGAAATARGCATV